MFTNEVWPLAVALQVYRDLQEYQDFQQLVAMVSPDLQASQEREVRRESPALRGSHCQAPQDVQGVLDSRVHLGPLDLQAFPMQDKTASLDSLGNPDFREREVTQETRARKVRE